jgi:hypothetical protein
MSAKVMERIARRERSGRSPRAKRLAQIIHFQELIQPKLMNATIKLSLHVLFLVAVAAIGRQAGYRGTAPHILKEIQKTQQDNIEKIQWDLKNQMYKMFDEVDVKTNYYPIFEHSQSVLCSLQNISTLIDSCKKVLIQSNDVAVLSSGELGQELYIALRQWRLGQIVGVKIDPEKLDRFIDIISQKEEEIWLKKTNNTWGEYFFGGCDVACALVMLDELQMQMYADTKNIIVFLDDQIGKFSSHFWSLDIHARPIKFSEIVGDEYISEIAITAPWFGTVLSAWVNDSLIFEEKSKIWHSYRIPFKLRSDKLGLNSYTAKLLFINPHTEQIDSCHYTFYYHVIVPNVNINTLVQLQTAPVPILAELRGGDITREKLIFPITLQAEDKREIVLSFTLWHLQKGEEPKAYQIKSNKIPAYILEKIQAGDQLQFVDIRAQNQNNLPTMAFIVSD